LASWVSLKDSAKHQATSGKRQAIDTIGEYKKL